MDNEIAALLSQGRLQDAKEMVVGRLSLSPDDPRMLYTLAVVSIESGSFCEAYQHGLACLERRLGRKARALVYHLMGTAAYRLDWVRLAVQLHQEALSLSLALVMDLDLTCSMVEGLAHALYRCGRSGEAIARLRAHVARHDEAGTSWYALGTLYTNLGAYGAGIRCLETALRVMGTRDPVVMEQLGIALLKANRCLEALDVFLEALRRLDAMGLSTHGTAHHAILALHQVPLSRAVEVALDLEPYLQDEWQLAHVRQSFASTAAVTIEIRRLSDDAGVQSGPWLEALFATNITNREEMSPIVFQLVDHIARIGRDKAVPLLRGLLSHLPPDTLVRRDVTDLLHPAPLVLALDPSPASTVWIMAAMALSRDADCDALIEITKAVKESTDEESVRVLNVMRSALGKTSKAGMHLAILDFAETFTKTDMVDDIQKAHMKLAQATLNHKGASAKKVRQIACMSAVKQTIKFAEIVVHNLTNVLETVRFYADVICRIEERVIQATMVHAILALFDKYIARVNSKSLARQPVLEDTVEKALRSVQDKFYEAHDAELIMTVCLDGWKRVLFLVGQIRQSLEVHLRLPAPATPEESVCRLQELVMCLTRLGGERLHHALDMAELMALAWTRAPTVNGDSIIHPIHTLLEGIAANADVGPSRALLAIYAAAVARDDTALVHRLVDHVRNLPVLFASTLCDLVGWVAFVQDERDSAIKAWGTPHHPITRAALALVSHKQGDRVWMELTVDSPGMMLFLKHIVLPATRPGKAHDRLLHLVSSFQTPPWETVLNRLASILKEKTVKKKKRGTRSS